MIESDDVDGWIVKIKSTSNVKYSHTNEFCNVYNPIASNGSNERNESIPLRDIRSNLIVTSTIEFEPSYRMLVSPKLFCMLVLVALDADVAVVLNGGDDENISY